MITYEYKCKECRYKFEKKESIEDNRLKECPKCKGELNLVFHPPPPPMFCQVRKQRFL